MKKKLWFISSDGSPCRVFLNKTEADEEYDELYEMNGDSTEYEIYTVPFNDIEDYPDEFELAQEEGIFDLDDFE